LEVVVRLAEDELSCTRTGSSAGAETAQRLHERSRRAGDDVGDSAVEACSDRRLLDAGVHQRLCQRAIAGRVALVCNSMPRTPDAS
jgi:hypothetical protein